MNDFDRRILDEFKELERQMGRMLRSTSLSRTIPTASCGGGGWQPDVDVYETSDEIIVLMDTAGIDMDNMTVTAEKNSITVQGRRCLPKRGNVCCIHQLEIEMGFFKRKKSRQKSQTRIFTDPRRRYSYSSTIYESCKREVLKMG